MIPRNNRSYVVATVPFEKLDELILACQQAAVLPTTLPRGGGWDSIEVPIPRLDLKLRLSSRVLLGQVRLDAIVPGPAVEIRLGGAIQRITAQLDLVEISSGQSLAQFSYSVSGRVAITGTIESRAGEKAMFFKLLRVWVTPDDSTVGVPTPWPELDLQHLFSRILDRGIRAELNLGGALERRIPVNTNLETRGLISRPLFLAHSFQNSAVRDDWLQHPVCLPAGGSPACNAGAPVNKQFMNTLAVFASRLNAPVPDPIVPLGGRDFQIDIGADLIREAIRQQFSDKRFHPDPITFGPFQYRIEVEADYQTIPHSDNAEFAFKATLGEYAWYPEIIFCRGWTYAPWGDKWYYDYPCGVRDAWMPVREQWIETGFSFTSDGLGNICVTRRHIGWSSRFDTWGTIYKFVIEYVLKSIPYIGWIFEIAFAVWDAIYLLVEVLALLVADLLDRLLPGEACGQINATFAVLPQISDRVTLQVGNAFVETKTNGISVAFDGTFASTP
ncbi:hypothetical protein CO661_09855 [Sinorhizobium fredii]|uniref:Uncharacterized protein n=1 Tax=Rhizobium fredii TaxID=380 RepID=A0A2A6M0I5_RHIFR|nr:hypothetical protein [Sinorhizobium fredii]PDT48165.1 hypothetical protein CO661_09855 [Sinorhizobium fredii]